GGARGGRRRARRLDRPRAAHLRARALGTRGPRRGDGCGAAARRAGRGCGRSRPRRALPAASSGGRVKASFDPVPRLPHGTPFLLLDRVLEIGERTGAFPKLVDGELCAEGRITLKPPR